MDVLGLLAPGSEVDALCDEIESGELGELHAVEERLRDVHAAYADYEWAWAQEAWRQFAGKAPAEMTPEELVAALTDWRDAAIKLNNMILGDAEKEFGESARIGFGIDGDEAVRDRDLDAVRGTFDANRFVLQLREESDAIRARAERLIEVVGQA